MTSTDPDEDVAATFADLALRPELLAALTELGYEEPTPIQQAAIPPMLAGKDLLGQAATGTGKTAAFALPILQRLGDGGSDRAGDSDRGARGTRSGDGPIALVLVPTRELAIQVSEAVHRYGRGLGARVLPVYGGQPITRQLQALKRGVDVVVATPGRALDHLRRHSLSLAGLEIVVLDEADEMLDMGFAEDIEAIFAETPEERQTVLFSATLPARIDRIARSHLRAPVRLQIGAPKAAAGEAPAVRQCAYLVQRSYKPAALGRILDVEAPTAAIVFCRTRDEVDQLAESLNGRGYRAEALHGGMSQEQRDRVIGRVRAGTADLLVATDVAARGLDIEQLTLVVNYDVPSSPESYVHRIGRVGRAGRAGVAVTLAEPREHRMLKTLERAAKRAIPVEQLPSVADVRERRLAVTASALREQLAAGGLEGYRAVVASLAEEFDPVDVALAAVKLAAEAAGSAAGEEEIPEVVLRPEQRSGPSGERSGGRLDARPSAERSGRPSAERSGRPSAERSATRDVRREVRRDPSRGAGSPLRGAGAPSRGGVPSRGASAPRAHAPGMTRLYVGVGKEAGIRPQDLVGAIAGETGLSGREIGAIDIAPRFSLVEVPAAAAEDVIAALRSSTVKGRRATVRRERSELRGR